MRSVTPLDGGWTLRGFLGEDWALHRAALHARADAGGDDAWIPASVPGSVLADLLAAALVADPYRGTDSRLTEWVPQRTWVYRRTLAAPIAAGERVFLELDGIDAAATICLDGEPVARHEGMHVPLVFELTDRLGETGTRMLAVVIDPAPVSEPQVGRTSKVTVHKGRMGYGWDFCPRLVHQGLWRPARLRVTGGARLADVWARPRLDRGAARVEVTVTVDDTRPQPAGPGDTRPHHAGPEHTAVATLRAADGEIVAAGTTAVADGAARLVLDVPAPRRWHVNGHGEPYLYRLTTELVGGDGAVSDAREQSVGLRDVRFVAVDGGPPDALPYGLVVNDRPVYITGWNWVPVDALYGATDPARLRHLLGLARDAGVTMLRVWGGGLIETPEFYDLCDEYGILVWQEFAQSSSGMESVPSEDPAFVTRMATEAEAIVPSRRNSPSLAIWCGGNELQRPDGTPLPDSDSPVLTALSKVVRRLDPDRQWLPTSPSGPVFANTVATVASDVPQHDVHGPWEHQGLAAHYRLYDRGRSLLLSEFGVEGMSNTRAIAYVVPVENRRLPTAGDPVWDHLGRWWNNERLVQEAFGGELATLEELERASQLLQADGLRYAIEANRRRATSCGVLPWQLNESFPNGWCTAAVDYFGEPKAAYHAVRRAYRPLHVCAQLDTAVWAGRDRLVAGVWAWSDVGPLSGTVGARLILADGTVAQEQSWPAEAAEGSPCRVDELACDLTGLGDGIVVLDLTVREHGRQASTRQLVSLGTAFAALRHLDPARIEVRVADDGPDTWQLRLRHHGGPVAPFLRLLDARPAGAPGFLVVGDSGLDLLPGEECTVPVRWTDVPPADRRLRLDGWNVSPTVVCGPTGSR